MVSGRKVSCWIDIDSFIVVFLCAGIALKEEQEREAANKRNTLSHTPERKPESDSPRQSRSPLKNDKKEKVSD